MSLRDNRQSSIGVLVARDLRLPLAVMFVMGLAITFWAGSRYPSLNEKAMMGGDAPLSGFAFDILLDIFPDSSLWWQFIANNANWIMTNVKGMTFGVLFGAAAITLLSLIKKRSFKSGFANSVLGTLIGAPLGVCVNCAAPIAFGLHMGRMRLETTLSALVASPTLNVIVVSMSFALLPLHIALTKLVLALAMVLIVVPILCRFFLKEEVELTRGDMARIAPVSEVKGLSAWIARSLAPIDTAGEVRGVSHSLIWFIKSYSRNLFFVALITVPMMLLAAFMATVIAMGFDNGVLMTTLPRTGAVAIILAMLILAIVASLVPAPIALDVILTIVLLGLGLGSYYGAVLIIALGSFSFYAFLILWKAVSLRTALIMWGATICMSILGGIIAFKTNGFEYRFQAQRSNSFIASRAPVTLPKAPEIANGSRLDSLRPRLNALVRPMEPLAARISDESDHLIRVETVTGSTDSLVSDDPEGARFSRIPGPEVGLIDVGINTPLQEFGPEMMLGGIGAGDIHKDGWIDVIYRRPLGAKGLSLYANVGGRFERQALDLGPVDDLQVANTALVDLDNDGWLDLIVTTAWDGVFIFPNQTGNFSADTHHHLTGFERTTVMSIVFSDLDSDGRLDMIFGNWNSRQGGEGWAHLRPTTSLNQVAWNKGDFNFSVETMPGSPGQTLTGLVSDIDGDGQLEYIKGDDLAATDEVIFFDKDRNVATSRDRQPFPYLVQTSMSYDEGDWNNDLIPDYYGGQIAEKRSSGVRDSRRGDGRLNQVCRQYAADTDMSAEDVRACSAELQSINFIRTRRTGFTLRPCRDYSMSERDATLCGIHSVLRTSNNLDYFNGEINGAEARARCETRLARWPDMLVYCETFDLPVRSKMTREEVAARHVPASSWGNILMTGQQDGSFSDVAKEQGVISPGWTWNSQFSDLDQDGWLDLFVATGSWFNPSRSSTNMFYRNKQGQFSDLTEASGLFDMIPTYSFANFDFDRDGDIDIVRPPQGRTAIIHKNEAPAGPSLWVHLRDAIGNSMGVDARVTICTDGQTEVRVGQCQTRPVNAGGGFMSFDPIAAHFGLGDAQSVSLVEVVWRDGSVTRILPETLLDGEIMIHREQG